VRTRNVCAAVVCGLLLAGAAWSQKIPTGTLTGTVTYDAAPLPGVTVTMTSPNQQGARVAYSTVNGDYILDLLPPGPYTVRFELDGFQYVETTVKISGDLTSRVDAVMPRITTVAEEVLVAGTHDTISTSATSASAYESSLIHLLPVGRDVAGYVELTPGTVQLRNDDYYWVQIAGAEPSESLYLLNGAAANENLSWGGIPLYIEDAIQETTTSVASVSAEYGRFTGGVVSTLTKSGGNEFHGSLRLTLTNPKWTAPTPLTVERTDEIGQLWEGTIGGYVLRDKLWFFLGGRTASQTTSLQTAPPVSLPVDQELTENRYEGKLTFSLTPNHRVVGSYLKRERNWGNYYTQYLPVYDLDSFFPRSVPEDIEVLNYSGVLSNSFFLEAQVSARHLTRENEGSRYTDLERGTPVVNLLSYTMYNSPPYCAVCPSHQQRRDNTDAFAKGSVFLSTKGAGSHDLRFGGDVYDDIYNANIWQSGSNYWVAAAAVDIIGTGATATYYPVFIPGRSIIRYFPIFEMTNGDHFKTDSAFVNDSWKLNSRLTFNLGVRYDKNDGTDSSGTKVVKDSKWSPRLAATWDPKGDGATQVSLSYAEYVAGIQNWVANSQATGGMAADIMLSYQGPAINTESDTVQTHEALRQVFAWLNSIGGVMANPQLWLSASVPGYQTFIGNDLRSPSTTEWAVGVSRRFGTRGLVRLDYINRVWSDFYAKRVDTTTGTSKDPFGDVYDRIIVENDNTYTRRTYWGLLLQGDYRLGDRLHLGGDYTYSKLYGRDASVSGGSTTDLAYYPEYHDLRWYSPAGYLYGDRRHKLDLYASWDAVSTRAFGWNVSLLQRYLSGVPYGAISTFALVGPYVTNPGYKTPPTYTRYYFTAPDAYRTDPINSTDLAMTFTFKLWGLELYLNPRVTNLFNNQAVINPDPTAYTRYNKKYLAWFDPFTQTPKECPQNTTCNLADGYNWQKGPNFGKAVLPVNYQTPRSFLLNAGMRF
jgi:outer membrane receptor protein involved in Fe transport